MKMNDVGGKEMERTPIGGGELSKIKELAEAPVTSDAADHQREKIQETNGLIEDRLTQQKETQSTTADLKKETEQEKFKYDLGTLEENLNHVARSVSFGTSPGVCRDSHTIQNYCVFAGA